jgi:hypothetical protein
LFPLGSNLDRNLFSALGRDALIFRKVPHGDAVLEQLIKLFERATFKLREEEVQEY